MASNQNAGRGISESDNQMPGTLLMMGALGIVALFFLAISPILIGGFLIGLIWYGAYMADGEPDGERLFWPVLLTVAAFTYLLGLFPPFEEHFSGVLFADLKRWTFNQVGQVLTGLNEMLPRKLMIKSVTASQIRLYGWSLIPSAAAVCTYLHFKGAGRGVFLYRAARFSLAPFRLLASRWLWILCAAVLVATLSWIITLPASINVAAAAITALLALYRAMEVGFEIGDGSAAALPEKEGGLSVLGHEKGKPHRKIALDQDQLNHHVHIVGASGFGKSVLLSHMIKNRISSGDGLLLVDLKADFETIRQVVSTAKRADRMSDLFLFSCGNPEISSNYNVLKNGTANQLKDRLMGALNWSEEFYRNEAASFLLKILRGLTTLRDLKGRPFDLASILRCIEDQSQIRLWADELPDSESAIRGELEGLLSHLGKQENLKALNGLKSQLESLLLSDFGHLLRESGGGIDLFSAIRNRKIVYVLLDSRTYGESAKALGKLILQDLKAVSARMDSQIPRNLRTPFGVIIDEFADMATEDFIGFLDRARSSKIGVVVAHQEVADLSRISPEFTRRLMNSTSTLFAFLQKLPDSSELISAIGGTRKTKEVTEQAQTNWLFGDEKTGVKSIKEVDEFVIHPNVIRSLAVGECGLVQKYPRSKALIMKVRAETSSGYLSEEEVRSELKILTARHEKLRRETVTSPPPNEVNQGQGNYWDGHETGQI